MEWGVFERHYQSHFASSTTPQCFVVSQTTCSMSRTFILRLHDMIRTIEADPAYAELDPFLEFTVVLLPTTSRPRFVDTLVRDMGSSSLQLPLLVFVPDPRRHPDRILFRAGVGEHPSQLVPWFHRAIFYPPSLTQQQLFKPKLISALATRDAQAFEDIDDNVDPNVFGPSLWKLLFAVAQTIDLAAQPLRQAQFAEWIRRDFAPVVPCTSCRESATRFVQQLVIDDERQAFACLALVFELRVRVNRKVAVQHQWSKQRAYDAMRTFTDDVLPNPNSGECRYPDATSSNPEFVRHVIECMTYQLEAQSVRTEDITSFWNSFASLLRVDDGDSLRLMCMGVAQECSGGGRTRFDRWREQVLVRTFRNVSDATRLYLFGKCLPSLCNQKQ